jgi:hypothetical protein
MEIRPVRREEAAGLRELRLRALRDAPHAYSTSLESEESLPLSYWEGWATSKDEAAKALYRGLGFVPTERRSMASDPTRAGVFKARPL